MNGESEMRDRAKCEWDFNDCALQTAGEVTTVIYQFCQFHRHLDFTAPRPYAVVTLATTKEGLVKFTNVRELKTKTSEMLRTVERGNTVLVTTHGRPTAMLVPVTEDDIEDALLAYSPKLRKKIEEGLKDIRAGRTMLLSAYKAQRGRKKARTA